VLARFFYFQLMWPTFSSKMTHVRTHPSNYPDKRPDKFCWLLRQKTGCPISLDIKYHISRKIINKFLSHLFCLCFSHTTPHSVNGRQTQRKMRLKVIRWWKAFPAAAWCSHDRCTGRIKRTKRTMTKRSTHIYRMNDVQLTDFTELVTDLYRTKRTRSEWRADKTFFERSTSVFLPVTWRTKLV
jgi:hypothetical protein